ncbi:rootletin-like [Adelges cooleyi]|uniref:rootletin-like n=1 Tax=Adelges cooleyi TaxID=133065 RepID=UPI0021806704|nr:rootletin-like [Adelges cooleyi]
MFNDNLNLNISDLETKLNVLQKERQDQLNEIEDLKKKNVKEKEIIYEKENETKMLVSLSKELETLNNEKMACELKLAESKQQTAVSEQTLRSLENSLILAKDALKKSNEMQLSSLSENSITKQQVSSLTEEVNVLKSHLLAKDHQLNLYEEDKKMYVSTYEAKTLDLQKQLQTSKQHYEEKK